MMLGVRSYIMRYVLHVLYYMLYNIL